jgi:hypothetical protein
MIYNYLHDILFQSQVQTQDVGDNPDIRLQHASTFNSLTNAQNILLKRRKQRKGWKVIVTIRERRGLIILVKVNLLATAFIAC